MAQKSDTSCCRARTLPARRDQPTTLARAGSSPLARRRSDSRPAAFAERASRRVVSGLSRSGDCLVPRGCGVGWCLLPGEELARSNDEEAAAGHLQPPRTYLHFVEEIVRKRNGRLHGASMSGYTTAVKLSALSIQTVRHTVHLHLAKARVSWVQVRSLLYGRQGWRPRRRWFTRAKAE